MTGKALFQAVMDVWDARLYNKERSLFPYGKTDQDGKVNTVHRMNDSAWKKARARAAKRFQEQFLRPAPAGFGLDTCP